MTELFIEVRGQDIVVREPTSELSVTYRRTANEPLLVAVDPMRRTLSLEGRLCKGARAGLALMFKMAFQVVELTFDAECQ
jgi:hypothetical protein